MDTEGPSSSTTTTTSVPSVLQTKWNNYRLQQQQHKKQRQQNQHRPSPKLSSAIASICNLPWIVDNSNNNFQSNSNSKTSNIFLSHWNWQLEFLEQHLTNLRVNTEVHDDPLMYVESNDDCKNNNSTSPSQQRIYTVSLQSNEYRDIRMTYLHCGEQAQIFRCTCYPHNDMPILGMGLMQLGRHRHVAIIDFQPLLSTQEQQQQQNYQSKSSLPQVQQSTYIRRLEQIRSFFPSMQQPMSNRHFDPNEQQYFTANPIIGKWCNQDENASQCWQDLQSVHQDCVQTHVQLTQASMDDNKNNNNKDYVHQLHSDYDTFVASKEPASQLLSSAFGKDVAHQLVHQVIFPLSRHQQQQQ